MKLLTQKRRYKNCHSCQITNRCSTIPSLNNDKVWLHVLIISRTRFRVNPHSITA